MFDQALEVYGQKLFEYASDLSSLSENMQTAQLTEHFDELTFDMLPEEVELFREEACATVTKVLGKIDEPFARLADVFEYAGVDCMASKVVELEREILAAANFRDVDTNDEIQQFLFKLIDDHNLDSIEQLAPLSNVRNEVARAYNALNQAQSYLCKPTTEILAYVPSIKRLETMTKLVRDAGFMTADIAAFCGVGFDPSMLLFFTSAKSIITSSDRMIKTFSEIDSLVETRISVLEKEARVQKAADDWQNEKRQANTLREKIQRRNTPRIRGFKKDDDPPSK